MCQFKINKSCMWQSDLDFLNTFQKAENAFYKG